MEKRRANILAAARSIISEQGYDALTTRGLANAANVTVPTLYNLIGDMDQIVRMMITEGVEKVWARLDLDAMDSPLEMAEAIIEAATGMVSEDPEYFRAVTIGTDRIVGSYAAQGDIQAPISLAGQRPGEMAGTACRPAISQGLLRGKISAEALGQQMFICYRGPMRDWAYGLISIEECQRRAMRGFYLVMAADATPEFRDILVEKIVELESQKQLQTAA